MARLFRIAAAVAMASLLATEAQAISRIRADLNSCSTLQETLYREGAAVIRWPSKRVANYLLYDRYVSPSARCPWKHHLVRKTVPAADDPKCVVHKCERYEPVFEDSFGHRF